jgi:hypothetical protein
MAQFLLAVHHDPEAYSTSSKFGAYRDEAEMTAAYAATGAFNQKLVDEGVLVFAGGLTPPETTTTVDGRGREVVTTDGPAVEAAEYLGGFWVIDVPDRETALALAADGSLACGQRVQVRAFQGA